MVWIVFFSRSWATSLISSAKMIGRIKVASEYSDTTIVLRIIVLE